MAEDLVGRTTHTSEATTVVDPNVTVEEAMQKAKEALARFRRKNKTRTKKHTSTIKLNSHHDADDMVRIA